MFVVVVVVVVVAAVVLSLSWSLREWRVGWAPCEGVLGDEAWC